MAYHSVATILYFRSYLGDFLNVALDGRICLLEVEVAKEICVDSGKFEITPFFRFFIVATAWAHSCYMFLIKIYLFDTVSSFQK
jgi:hypothetical protein